MDDGPKYRRIENEKILRFAEDLLFGSLSNHQTIWRIIPLTNVSSICEYESQTLEGTFCQFSDWVTRPSFVLDNNPFSSLPKFSDGVVAVYADYKYFFHLFPADSTPSLSVQETKFYHRPQAATDLKQNLSEEDILFDWKEYDESAVDGREATLWIGSRGAHTPLHYDSYGRNLILQIFGEKVWSLWRPSDENMNKLAPRRVPFEESTVYADPQQYDPQIPSHTRSHPPEVTQHLTPQDVLNVPKHWWHYVSTVSANYLSILSSVPPPSLFSLLHR
jgi:hypothetical protein